MVRSGVLTYDAGGVAFFLLDRRAVGERAGAEVMDEQVPAADQPVAGFLRKKAL